MCVYSEELYFSSLLVYQFRETSDTSSNATSNDEGLTDVGYFALAMVSECLVLLPW